jgi:hypothetical protein
MIQKVRKSTYMRIPLTTKPRLFASLVLFTVLLIGCAPAESTASPEQREMVDATATNQLAGLTQDPSTDVVSLPTEVPASIPVPIATSRGPDLHATDPVTVSLASGGLQLVEFFRFT